MIKKKHITIAATCLVIALFVFLAVSTATLSVRVSALESEQRETAREHAREAIIAAQSCENEEIVPIIETSETEPLTGDFTIEDEMRQTSLGEIEITHYCDCEICNGKWAGQTASGAVPTEGRTIACDFLPMGAIVNIGGHLYTVEDRAGDGRVDHIDVFVNDHQRALDAGRYRAECYVVTFGEDE